MVKILFKVNKKSDTIDEFQKSMGHKYIKRIPKPTGKGWYYIYKESFKNPLKALLEIFKIDEKRISKDYETEKIEKNYGVDKKTFAAHILEYFTNKEKWNSLFSKKEERDRSKEPVKQKTLEEETLNAVKKQGLVNRSLMRKVWTLYSVQGKQIEQSEAENLMPKDTKEQRYEIKETLKNGHRIINRSPIVTSPEGEQFQLVDIETDFFGIKKISTYDTFIKNGVQTVINGDGFVPTGLVIGKVVLQEGEKDTQALSDAMLGNQNAKKDFKDLTDSIKNKSSFVVKNNDLGDVEVSYEKYASDLKHIIKRRFDELHKKGKSYLQTEEINEKITATLFLIINAIRTGKPILQDDKQSWILQEKGVTAIVRKNKEGKLLITGFTDNRKKEEAEDSINAVNAEYRYTPEFLDLYAQVGASTSTLSIAQNIDLSSKITDNYKQETENGTNNTNNGRDGFPDNSGNVRSGTSENDSNRNVLETEHGSDTDGFIQLPRESGIGLGGSETSGGEPGGRLGRLTKGKAKAIREQCRELLAIKTNEQMTDADISLLSQYEGAGGLKEGNQSDVAVLSEFYTPRDVISKLWELVDKYNPNTDKKVIEPSSGIGRFAEDRNEHFTLCELDETSSRIAQILHPKAEVKKGAFQNLFMKNNAVLKDYKGEKYDVAVGNPPYGEYTGLHKGMGEGKIHTRYEEYFIDRTLDTLKDGGIMAFVIPSGFLRGKDSKAKSAIAAKGKLLEAWRLPKGTFSSTDVGTDIIILRKEKGNIKDFIDNNYFSTTNESHVIGHETDGGNWGTKIINLPEGKTVEEAIAMIDAHAVANENMITEKSKNIVVETTIRSQKKFIITGKLKVGASVLAQDGTKGTVTVITDSGMVSYKFEDGRAGRLSIDSFEVATDTKTAQELHNARSNAMKGNENAKKAFHNEVVKKSTNGDIFEPSIGKNMHADEFNKKYSKNISEQDMKFWKVTDWEGKVDVTKLSKAELEELKKNKNFVLDENNNFVNVANYTCGNIYEKLANLEKEKNRIDIDFYKEKKAILEKHIPTKKSIFQFTLSPIANFAKQFKNESGENLAEQFLKYLGFNEYGRIPNEEKIPLSKSELEDGMNLHDIWEYVYQKPVRAERSRNFADKETAQIFAEQTKKARRECTERLFNEWVRKLPKHTQDRIEGEWNKRFNAIVNPDYKKIPLFIEGMNTHKGKKKFDMTEQQIKGVSTLCNKGNGILAYDVGVGKTVTGIVATVNQMQSGKSKKPLICVPKAVYKKWIKEIKQHFPNVTVNELSNFNEKDLGRFKDSEGNISIPENALNICTYEALQKVTFKEETLQGSLRDDMLDSQSVYDYDENGNLVADTRSDREKAKANEDLLKKLGQSAKAKEGAVYWEDLGIDHITVDELHNFKNIFEIPRTFGKSIRSSNEKMYDRWGASQKAADDPGQLSNEYQGIKGISGSKSSRGMKLFAISQLIQRETDGRGVFGLSATPFNNSPVEIYNILSLVARNRLKECSIYNLQDFLREFAEMKPDWKVDQSGNVKNELVMKNFKNLGSLQNLITEFIDKVDGEEAGVIRPYKRVHKPVLDLTPLQKAIIKAETDRAQGRFRKGGDDDNNADTLIAMNNMRLATLSPSLIDPKFWGDYEGYEGWYKPELKNIVKESPKLQFVCDTTAKQYKERPTEGQVIYMPRGVDHYKYVKDYLVEKGMSKDSIAFMGSGISIDKKEQIMKDFNSPDGKIKVIIGSETIKEGVSLNGNSTTIYNTMLGWNPTETIQVEGRIWRQGNKQGVTHIVYPLMNDSIDSMMYQKYDEKSSRLNALWSYKGDSLNVEDINPEELKFELIKDPEKRANMKILQLQADLKQQKRMANINYDNLYTMRKMYYSYRDQLRGAEEAIPHNEKRLEDAKADLQKNKDSVKIFKNMLKKDPDNKDVQYSLNSFEREVEFSKNLIERRKSELRMSEKFAKDMKEKIEAIDNTLQKQGIDSVDDIELKLKTLTEKSQSLESQITGIDKQRDEFIEEERVKIEEQQKKQKHYTVDDMVRHYYNEIGNDLRNFENVKSAIQLLRTYSSTQIQKIIDDVNKNGSATVGDDVFTSKDLKELQTYKNKATIQKSLCFFKGGRLYFVKPGIKNIN